MLLLHQTDGRKDGRKDSEHLKQEQDPDPVLDWKSYSREISSF